MIEITASRMGLEIFIFIPIWWFPPTLSGSASAEKEKRKGGVVRPWACVASLANANGYDAQWHHVYHFFFF